MAAVKLAEIEKVVDEVAAELGVDRREALRRCIAILEAMRAPDPPQPPLPTPYVMPMLGICGFCGQYHVGVCEIPVYPVTYRVTS